MSDFKDCLSIEEGLVIATGGEGEKGGKVNLKICLAGELNPGNQRERREHWPLYQGGLIKIYRNIIISPERPLAIRH